MKRIIISLIIFFAILFGAAWFITNDASSLLSSYLSARLRVKVKMKQLLFHPQGITIKNFKIKNPEGSPLPDAFKADTIEIHAPWVSYLRNPIAVDSVIIDGVYLSLILPKDKKIACNWVKIFHNLDEESNIIRSSQRSFTIGKLLVDNLYVELSTAGKKPQTVGPIKTIEIDNINSEEGLPLRTFTKAIMNELMKKLFTLEIIQKSITTILTLPFGIFQFIFRSSGSDDAHPCAEIYKDVDDWPAPKTESQPRGGGSIPSAGSKLQPGNDDQKQEDQAETSLSA